MTVLSRSKGAVNVRETAPAIAPAIKFRDHKPTRVSSDEKSSGTMFPSPISTSFNSILMKNSGV